MKNVRKFNNLIAFVFVSLALPQAAAAYDATQGIPNDGCAEIKISAFNFKKGLVLDVKQRKQLRNFKIEGNKPEVLIVNASPEKMGRKRGAIVAMRLRQQGWPVETRIDPTLSEKAVVVDGRFCFMKKDHQSARNGAPLNATNAVPTLPKEYIWQKGERVSQVVGRWFNERVKVIVDGEFQWGGIIGHDSQQAVLNKLSRITGCRIEKREHLIEVDCGGGNF